MKVLVTGQLGSAVAGSGVSGNTWTSGVSTAPIDLTRIDQGERVGIWLLLTGNPGLTTASFAVIWKGSYNKEAGNFGTFKQPTVASGVTGNYLIKSAQVTGNATFAPSTVSGLPYLITIQPCVPFIRLQAIQTGVGTTNATILKWAVCAF